MSEIFVERPEHAPRLRATTPRIHFKLSLSRLVLFGLVATPILFYINPGGVPIFMGYALTMLLAGLLALAKLPQIFLPAGGRFAVHIPLLIPLFMIVSLPGILFNPIQSSSFLFARYLHLINYLIFFLLVRYAMGRWQLDRVIFWLLLIGLISPLVALAQSISFNQLGSYAIIELFRARASWLYGANAAEYFVHGYYSWLASTTFLKAPGVFTIPAENAFYSLMLLCIALALYVKRVQTPRWGNRFLILVCSLQIINILLAATRSVWLATLLAVCLLLGRQLLFSRKMIGLLVIGGLALAVAGTLIGAGDLRSFTDSIFTRRDASSIGRLGTLVQGLELFLQRPLTGVGLGNADLMLGGNIHALWVTMLAELGVLGLLYLVLFVGATIGAGLRLARSPEPLTAALGSAFFAIACAHAFNSSLFANDFFHPKIALPFWGLYALVVGLSAREEPATHEEPA